MPPLPPPNARSGGKQAPCLGCGRLDLKPVRSLANREHCRLQLRAVKAQTFHLRLRDGLDDKVDVHGTSSGVGPETVVDLISRNEPTGHRGGFPEQRPEFSRLLYRQIPHRGDVAFWLDDQCPEAERSDAVLDEPKGGPVDEATRQLTVAPG